MIRPMKSLVALALATSGLAGPVVVARSARAAEPSEVAPQPPTESRSSPVAAEEARRRAAMEAVARGQQLASQKRNDEALDAFREALSQYEAYPLAHHEIALLLVDKGDLPGAEANLRKALGMAPDFERAEQALGEVLRRSKRLDEALTHFANAIHLDGRDLAAWYGAAAALDAQGKRDQSLWAMQQLLDIAGVKGDDPSAPPPSKLVAEVLKAVAVAKDDDVEARRWAGLDTQVAKPDEKKGEPKAALGPDGLPVHEGDVDFRRQAYVAALEAYKKQAATKDGEKDAILAYKIGAVYAIMNEGRLAIQAWRKALALDPASELVGRHLALLVAKQRATELATKGPALGDAIARARQALLAGDPATALWLVKGSDDPAAATLEGEARLQLGDFVGARAVFEELLGADPDDHVAKGGLAEALLRGPPTPGSPGLADKALAAWVGDDDVRLDTFLVLRRGEVMARVLTPEPEE